MEINTYGISFSLGGTYFGDADHGVMVLGRDDPGWPGLKRTYHELPYRAGGESDGGYLKPLEWKIPCRIMGASESEVRSRLETLVWPMQSEEDQQLIFDSRPDVYWMVAATEAAPAQWDSGQGGLDIEFVFQLSDPTGYDVEETTKTFTITSDPQTFSVLAGSLENGSVPPWPTWILEAGASALGFTLTNNTTGQQFSSTVDLESGDFTKLESRDMETWVSPDGVTYGRDNSGTTGTYPRLKPRVTNSITVTGLTAGTLTLKYRERYAAAVR